MEDTIFKFICKSCFSNVTCFCERKDCTENHELCPICEFIETNDLKPVKGSIKDRKHLVCQ